MEECRTCRWNSKEFCGRTAMMGIERGIESIPIKDCHAWQEIEKCECEKRPGDGFWPLDTFKMICKKCGKEYG